MFIQGSTLADGVGVVLAMLLAITAVRRGTQTGQPQLGMLLLVILALHLTISLAGESFGVPTEQDAIAFHLQAERIALGIDEITLAFPSSKTWSSTIGFLYMPFGASWLLGCVFVCWFLLFALLELHKLAAEIGAKRYATWIVAVAGLAPASLLNASYVLREPFQMFLLVIALRALFHYWATGRVSRLLVGVGALMPFGAIHNGFFMYIPVAVTLALCMRASFPPVGQDGRGSIVSGVMVAGVAAVVFASALTLVDSGRVDAVFAGEIDVGENFTRTAARTEANSLLPWTPPPGLLETLLYAPMLIVQFIGAPIFPFIIRRSVDLVAGADALIRIVCLYGCIRSLLHPDRNIRRAVGLFLGFYVLFVLLAAVGTTTAGTAMRHHLKVFWIIILVGIPGLSRREPAPIYAR